MPSDYNPLHHRAYVALQYLLPHHLLSRAAHAITRSEWRPLRELLIHRAVRHFGADLGEAERPHVDDYRSFNDFFTRALRPGLRPIEPAPDRPCCPVDGRISQIGEIDDGRILQAKGHDYGLDELLGGRDEWVRRFAGGSFATLYLSPRDYHRIHMPLAGRLLQTIHVPGRLFSVNAITTRRVPRLFARNERVICLFETAQGPLAMVLVGAIFVASIDTAWAGPVTPARLRPQVTDYGAPPAPVELAKGTEMGRFNMGSTVILLFPPETMSWDDELRAETPVRVGQSLGRLLERP